MNFLVGLVSVVLNSSCALLILLLFSLSFDIAFLKTLKHEGGYVHSLGDGAGPTNMGITIGTFRQYTGDPNASHIDLKQLRKSDVRAIYKDMFWDEYNISSFPFGLRDLVFDMVVQHGHFGASRLIQRALNDLGNHFPVTGIITDEQMYAIQSIPTAKIRDAINIRRMLFIKSITSKRPFNTMKKGLEARVRSYDQSGATSNLTI